MLFNNTLLTRFWNQMRILKAKIIKVGSTSLPHPAALKAQLESTPLPGLKIFGNLPVKG